MRSIFLVATSVLLSATVAACSASSDGASDAAPDANACMGDSTELVCCCEGDIGGSLTCEADGSYSCSVGSVYFGADCTRSCGPCSIACPDSGAD